MKNKKFILALLLLIISSILLIGLSYAYFSTKVIGNTSETSAIITAGSFELRYFDGNNTVTLENMKPDTTVEKKTFSVKNTGTNKIDNYGVYLIDVINELKFYEDLDYTLTCKEYYNNEYIRDCNGTSNDFPQTDNLLVTNSINVNYVHEYELEVKYIETNKNQSEDMNKKISGKIQIYDMNDIVAISGKLPYYNNYPEEEIIFRWDGKDCNINIDGSFYIPIVEPGIYDISLNILDEDPLAIPTGHFTGKFEIIKGNIVSYNNDNFDGIVTINNESNIIELEIILTEDEDYGWYVLDINTTSIDNMEE